MSTAELVSLRQCMNSIDKGIHYLDYICTEKSLNVFVEKDFSFFYNHYNFV
jgi:hypothetical protein